MNIKDFEQKLNAYDFSNHQDFLTYFTMLKRFNFTHKDVKKYVKEKRVLLTKEKKEVEQKQKKWNKFALRCPDCSTIMNLFPINNKPENQTGDNSKSQWVCPNCWYDEFSELSTGDWLKRINES